MEYDNTNTGVLFKNDKKDSEKQPDYRGKVDVNGTEYELAAWIREAKSGKGKFMSLKIQLPRDKKPAPKPQGKIEDLDSDVPW
jgi:uncharacterized protein (DUF736 family)